jgi:hypothetical protein
MSRLWVCDRRLGLDWMIGFIDTLHTRLRTIGNYSAASNLRTLQFTIIHEIEFSVFTSRIVATDFITISLHHTLQISLYIETSLH